MLAVVLALIGCEAKSDLVEIRLYPCLIDAMDPRSVRVEIQPYDEEGKPIDDALEDGFTVPEEALSDGYASLGYRPTPDVVTADITLRWYIVAPPGPRDDADLVVTYDGLMVPNVGEVIELGAQECEDVAGTSGGPTTSGGTQSSTSGGPTTASSSGTTATTDTTMGTSATTTPLTTTDDDSTSTTTDPTTSDDTSSGTTGGNSVIGESCDDAADTWCESLSDPPGEVLECVGDVWTPGDAICPLVCTGALPNFIGCAGFEMDWACLCQSNSPGACTEADNGCSGGDVLTLCVDGFVAQANCLNDCSYTSPGDYTCF